MRRATIIMIVFGVAFVLAACSKDTTEKIRSAVHGTTTTAPVLPDGACAARMSDPNPGQGGSETVIVDSHFASQPVVVIAHYKSKDSTFSDSMSATKHAELTFSIGQPTAGHPVTVDVTVGNPSATPPAGEKCQATFTPH